MVNFGDRLRRLREGKNIKQNRLAKIFKISESSVSMYERNEREPSFELTRRFADFFDVSTDYLLGHTDDQKGHSVEEEKHYAKGGFLDMDEEEEEKVEEYLEFLRSQKRKHDKIHGKE